MSDASAARFVASGATSEPDGRDFAASAVDAVTGPLLLADQMRPTPRLPGSESDENDDRACAGIPLILHQTWRNLELPPRFARWRAAWRALHPHWEHRFYTDADIRRIVTDRAPQLLGTLDALPYPVQRVDLFRYLIVYLDGGLYADLDMVPFRANDPLLEGASCVLAVEHKLTRRRQAKLGYRIPWQLSNSIFAAAAGHPFLRELIERIVEYASNATRNDDDVLETTGPRMLSRLAFDLPANRRGEIRVLPQIVWMPPWELPRVGPIARRIYARHIAAGSWRTDHRWLAHWHHLLEWNRWQSPFAVSGPELP
jgi:mannosyltransferase OCH1-like enzyme